MGKTKTREEITYLIGKELIEVLGDKVTFIPNDPTEMADNPENAMQEVLGRYLDRAMQIESDYLKATLINQMRGVFGDDDAIDQHKVREMIRMADTAYVEK